VTLKCSSLFCRWYMSEIAGAETKNASWNFLYKLYDAQVALYHSGVQQDVEAKPCVPIVY
ncbi:hypothetical protein Q0P05_14470, partial [Staphylococcus aureus]|nr:hypothetical protein [Staphylococcus aureus]